MRLNYGATVPWVNRLDDSAINAIAGPERLVLRTSAELYGEDLKTVGEFVVEAGQSVPFVLAYGASFQDPPPAIRPNAVILFFAFRIMVGIALLMIGLGLWSLWQRWRGTLFKARWLQRAAVLMGPAGFMALLAGWFVAEVGRQPYTVYGLLRTADSASPIAAPTVASSAAAFVVVYFVVFGAGIFFLMRMMARPPQLHESEPETGVPIRTAGITAAPSFSRQSAAGRST
jgi:cytochrome d ubiquinol oxidase subunit I